MTLVDRNKKRSGAAQTLMSYTDTTNTLFENSGAGHALKQIKSAVSLGKVLAEGGADDAAHQAMEILEQERPEVKQMLAFELRLVADLPEVVVSTIAKSDDPSVSVPFLEVSPAVTEELLLSIIDELNGSAKSAVARRPDVSETVATALIDCSDEKVALCLARNDKALISEDVLKRIVAKFPNDARIVQSTSTALNRTASSKPAPAAPAAASSDSALPFNVLMSRARAFQKNGMLKSEYLLDLLRKKALSEFEAALCVLSDKVRKDVRMLVLRSNDTRIDLEQLCKLAPGTLSGSGDLIQICYAAAGK